jgi:hypothetical protein
MRDQYLRNRMGGAKVVGIGRLTEGFDLLQLLLAKVVNVLF